MVVKELSDFEKDLCNLVKKVKFRRVQCSFQNKLNLDIKNISATSNVYTDKTSNISKITKEQYSQFLNNAVTSAYKKNNFLISKQTREKVREGQRCPQQNGN